MFKEVFFTSKIWAMQNWELLININKTTEVYLDFLKQVCTVNVLLCFMELSQMIGILEIFTSVRVNLCYVKICLNCTVSSAVTVMFAIQSVSFQL